jgi:hypothetical protein
MSGGMFVKGLIIDNTVASLWPSEQITCTRSPMGMT